MSYWPAVLRRLLRHPSFSVTALVLLIIGIGATTTLFSIADTVLLKPLPYPHAQELVNVFESSPKSRKESLIAPVRLEDWNRLNRTFIALAGFQPENVTDTSGSQPERLAARRVTPRYFSVYDAKPLLGRTFSSQEETFGGPQAAVIGYRFWSRRFHSSPDALGRRLIIGNQGYTIVGVMPKTFVSPMVDVWLPAPMDPQLANLRDARFLVGIGRMKPGITPQQAQDDLARVQRELGEQFPKTDKDWSVLVDNMRDFIVGDHGRSIWLMFAGVSLLLMIACANIAGLLLGQLYQREHEFAIRGSLGATRLQLIGTIMREIGLLVTAGGLGGVLLSCWGIAWASKTLINIPRMDELRFDWRVLLFVFGLCLLTAVIVGLIPALQVSYARLSAMLSRTSRTATGRQNSFQRNLLVAQLAVTMILLSGAGLLLRSYYQLTHVNTGFNAQHVLTFHVGAEWSEDRAAVTRLQENILTELRRLPQVENVGMTNFLPAEGATLRYHVAIEGLPGTAEENTDLAGSRTVTAGYLRALQVPLISGQTCPAFSADQNQPAKALVNRSFVQRFSRGQSLIGKYFTQADFTGGAKTQIVGVIGNVREDNFRTPATPYVYGCAMANWWPDPEYVVRTRGDSRQLMNSIRSMIHRLAPYRAVFGMGSLASHIDADLAQSRLTAQLLAALAFVALVLAAVGLYSLANLVVTTKAREIGLRMTLGAQPGQILKNVLRDAGRLLLVGIVTGLIASVAAGRTIHSLLFGVQPADFLTLSSVTVLLFLVGLLAALLPARRAASIDPVEALRLE